MKKHILSVLVQNQPGVLAHIATEKFQMSPLVMSAVTTVAACVVSYFLSSLWVFADHSRAG